MDPLLAALHAAETRGLTLFRLLVVGLSLTAALAQADVPPRNSIGCRDKIAGATCSTDDGASGACAKDTCTRNDYSQGPPPKQVPYECLTCVASAPAKKSGCGAVTDLSLAALAAWLVLRRRRPAS